MLARLASLLTARLSSREMLMGSSPFGSGSRLESSLDSRPMTLCALDVCGYLMKPPKLSPVAGMVQSSSGTETQYNKTQEI